MVQIYKSDLVDLLLPSHKAARSLRVVMEENNCPTVEGATKIYIPDLIKNGPNELIKIFNRGLDNRLMRSTDVNETSSRSHLLFSMKVSARNETGSSNGKITFVDLAGSERVACINLAVHLYEEALYINESLKYLGFIVRCLASGRAHSEIDFSLNPLTSLLSDTIGGNARTLMIVCMSPSDYDKEATLDTLNFAKETGKIKNHYGELPQSETAFGDV